MDLLQNLADSDLDQAILFYQKNLDFFENNRSRSFTKYFIEKFGEEEPEKTLAWIKDNKDKLESMTVVYYYNVIASSEMPFLQKKKIFDELLQINPDYIYGFISKWTENNPAEVEKWIATSSNKDLQVSFARGYPFYNLEESIRFIEPLSIENKRYITHAVLSEHNGKYSAQDLLSWYDEVLPINDVNEYNQEVISLFIREDPEAAYEWIQKKDNSDVKKSLIQEYKKIMDIPFYDSLKHKLDDGSN